jgi:cellulose 1,4-beta-cellobiosidase
LIDNMKGFYAAVAASAITGALAAPSPVEKAQITPAAQAPAAACATPVTLNDNPFASRSIFANPFYASEVSSAAAAMTDAALAEKALKVADVGTFQWM